MKVKITASFQQKLNTQVSYIAKDKPGAARKFKNELLKKL